MGSLGTQICPRQMGTLGTRLEPLGVTGVECGSCVLYPYLPISRCEQFGNSVWNLQTVMGKGIVFLGTQTTHGENG